MGSLNAFLHPVKEVTEKIAPSKRYLKDGQPLEFEIRAISQKENTQIIKKYTRRDKKGNETFDRVAYSSGLVAAAIVNPDLTDAKTQEEFGVLGEVELLNTMFNVGEFANLSQAVQKLSGLDIDINEDIEEVKNV